MFFKNVLIVISFLLLASCGEDCKFNSIKTEFLPDGMIGAAYDAHLTYDITCSYTDKYFEIINGSLPAGLEMSRAGQITGTPTKSGVFNFRVYCKMCFSSNGYEFSDCTEREKDLQITVPE